MAPWSAANHRPGLRSISSSVTKHGSSREVGDEECREHEQVRDRLINSLGVDHPRSGRRRCWLVMRHGQLHEPGEEEGSEQQDVSLDGRRVSLLKFAELAYRSHTRTRVFPSSEVYVNWRCNDRG